MFDFLSHKFSSLFKSVTGQGKLTEKNIQENLTQIKESLLEADVPYEVIEHFIESVKKEVLGQKVLGSLKPGEQFLKVVNDKLVAFLGGKQEVQFSFQLPAVVMVVGLQGSGKTTTLAKLANYAQKQAEQKGKKRRILLSSVDYYRPAAIDQLEVLARTVGVDFYRATAQNPVSAAAEIHAYYKNNSYELLFLDTAGRLHVDNVLLQELRDIDDYVNPKYKFLVLDAMTGQESLNVARAFDQSVGFQSAILSKIDSDTRGGAAFAFRYSLQKPILFMGTGEKIGDLEQFYPERMASRILGMGDLVSLAEKASQTVNQIDQEKSYKNFMQGKMTLQDFADQLSMINKMGSLTKIMKYMPGTGGMQMSPDMLDKGETEMKRFRAIISSMTPKERVLTKILDGSRKLRIARGAGVQVSDVNQLLSKFEEMQQFVKLFKSSGRFPRLF